jgi:hypothetical protein
MELCEIVVTPDDVIETSRFRIPPPNDPKSYCEKNWMPILDMPYHYVKWCSPTEVTCVDPENKASKTIFLQDSSGGLRRDLRGGSQVLDFGDYYLTCTHEVDLFNSEVGRKDAVYHHRFIVWDKNWKIIKYSNEFSFMDAHVEFCVGMCKYKNNDILMTFGFQDNAAFLLKTNLETIFNFIDKKI